MMRGLLRTTLLSLGIVSAVASAQTQQDDTPREGGMTGTGIVALVSARGTIDVNGLSITYPTELALDQKLQPGDTIAALIEHDTQGWVASSINPILPLVGPVSEQSETSLTIMGTQVLRTDTQLAITVGDWVAVSGFWREDGVVATRLRVIAPQPFAQIQGTYQQGETDDGQIGDSLVLDAARMGVRRGDVIRALGTPTESGIAVRSFEAAPFKTPIRTVLTQGYLSVPDDGGNYSVLGAGFTSRTERPEMIDPQAFVTFCGVDGKLLVPELKIEDARDTEILSLLRCYR
ncbi:DUF5666 domain-containing protein [Litoreibacter sp.]|nr:DUF5666 domain-containing protein [Litoreibacter sp.]